MSTINNILIGLTIRFLLCLTRTLAMPTTFIVFFLPAKDIPLSSQFFSIFFNSRQGTLFKNCVYETESISQYLTGNAFFTEVGLIHKDIKCTKDPSFQRIEVVIYECMIGEQKSPRCFS